MTWNVSSAQCQVGENLPSLNFRIKQTHRGSMPSGFLGLLLCSRQSCWENSLQDQWSPLLSGPRIPEPSWMSSLTLKTQVCTPLSQEWTVFLRKSLKGNNQVSFVRYTGHSITSKQKVLSRVTCSKRGFTSILISYQEMKSIILMSILP